jgi:hypothetical protein
MAAAEENLRFIDDKERELYGAAVLGEKAVAFFKNDPVGQYLHHRAKLIIEQAQVDALAVDPDNWRGWFRSKRKLRQIRARAAVARMFINWLADAIVDGRNAEKELDEYRNPPE